MSRWVNPTSAVGESKAVLRRLNLRVGLHAGAQRQRRCNGNHRRHALPERFHGAPSSVIRWFDRDEGRGNDP